MKGSRCDRILAGMTVAVTLIALFSVFQWVTEEMEKRSRRRIRDLENLLAS
jgi:hypothetical protein